jgi:hypothetical protein
LYVFGISFCVLVCAACAERVFALSTECHVRVLCCCFIMTMKVDENALDEVYVGLYREFIKLGRSK